MKLPKFFGGIAVAIISLFLSFLSLHAQTVMHVVPETLAVHSGPSAQDAVISELSKGDKVTVTDVKGEWAAIAFWSRNGYVLYKYLREVNSESSSSQSVTTSTPKPVTPAKKEAYVLICNSTAAYAYHSYTCHGLARCTHGVSKVTESEAKAAGYVPCKICY